MTETTKLPLTIRTCPECGAGMVAQRASRGDGWADAGLRFLYCCQICQHKAVLETRQSENLTMMASGFLVLSGIATLCYRTSPVGLLFGALFLLLGVSSFWFSWRSARTYRPKRGSQSVAKTVEVEEEFLIKGVDESRHRWMQRYGVYVIYSILILTAVVVLSDWVGA